MSDSIRHFDWADTSIIDVIHRVAVSLRLSNALMAANSDGGLPYETVGEYLQGGPSAKLKFLSVRNLGIRSANELDEVIRSYASNGADGGSALNVSPELENGCAVPISHLQAMSGAIGDPDQNAMLIVDLIQRSDVSVRLSNALMAANSDGGLPYETVGEYLQGGPSAKLKFLSVRNLGIQSANELDEVIRNVVNNRPSGGTPKAPDASTQLEDARGSLIGLFAGLNFPEILLDGSCSTRLRNVLHVNKLDLRTFAEFLHSYPAVCVQLIRLPNLGRKSVAELHALCEKLTGQLLSSWGMSNDEQQAAHELIYDQTAPSADMLRSFEGIIHRVRLLPDPYACLKVGDENLLAAVMVKLAAVAPRERSVIERRYGFVTGETEPLEKIGQDYGVTRERIRQIEARVLRRLGLARNVSGLRLAFDKEIGEVLTGVMQCAPYIRDGDEIDFIRRLPAHVRLTIDVLYGDRRRFLGKHATRCDGGWLFLSLSKAKLDEALEIIESRLRHICFPAPLGDLISGMSPDVGIAAIDLGTDLVVFDGYVAGERAGTRRRRTVHLHKALLAAGKIMEARDLLAKYHKIAPNDPCSIRDAMIVMLEARHLFLPMLDAQWYALGTPNSAGPTITIHEEQAANSLNAVPERSDEESIRSVLRRVLLKHGPLRFVDLRREAAKGLGGKSTNSIGPILLTSGEFVRPLPGIYALPQQASSSSFVPTEAPSFLLTEEQARWFAMARHAGEPLGRYPLWIPEAEYALCRWAQSAAEAVTFQSLIAVAAIDTWPIPFSERAHWAEIKKKQGRYSLGGQPRYPISRLLPDLDRLLAACAIALQDDGLSWITANRILKRRLDAHVSAGLLALMVALEVLVAPQHWQLRHQPGPRIREMISLLDSALRASGVVPWRSQTGERLHKELLSIQSSSPLGWVSRHAVNELVSATSPGEALPLPIEDEMDESASTFEELLREAHNAEEADRAVQTLQSVLTSEV